ncbi:hypothetical protein AMS68_003240 [Peltaster fructicola]|uniref:Uncharacterized protein n=1 Tax=Peltaster fructicola TaxID=286661 RepID=A0A6H0XSM3_9PEZI|nr:hypothetical protein AMS68_003240 [Peltaster fructicola]
MTIMPVKCMGEDDLQQKLAQDVAHGKHIRAHANISNHVCSTIRVSWSLPGAEANDKELLRDMTTALPETSFDFYIMRSRDSLSFSYPIRHPVRGNVLAITLDRHKLEHAC